MSFRLLPDNTSQWGTGKKWLGSFIYDPDSDRLYFGPNQSHPGIVDRNPELGDKIIYDDEAQDLLMGQVFEDREDPTQLSVSFFSDWIENQPERDPNDRMRAYKLLKTQIQTGQIQLASSSPQIIQHEEEEYHAAGSDPYSGGAWENKRRPWIYNPSDHTVHVGPPGSHHIPLAYIMLDDYEGDDGYDSGETGFVVPRDYPAFAKPTWYNQAGVHSFREDNPEVMKALGEHYNVPVKRQEDREQHFEQLYAAVAPTINVVDTSAGRDHDAAGGYSTGLPVIYDPKQNTVWMGSTPTFHMDLIHIANLPDDIFHRGGVDDRFNENGPRWAPDKWDKDLSEAITQKVRELGYKTTLSAVQLHIIPTTDTSHHGFGWPVIVNIKTGEAYLGKSQASHYDLMTDAGIDEGDPEDENYDPNGWQDWFYVRLGAGYVTEQEFRREMANMHIAPALTNQIIEKVREFEQAEPSYAKQSANWAGFPSFAYWNGHLGFGWSHPTILGEMMDEYPELEKQIDRDDYSNLFLGWIGKETDGSWVFNHVSVESGGMIGSPDLIPKVQEALDEKYPGIWPVSQSRVAYDSYEDDDPEWRWVYDHNTGKVIVWPFQDAEHYDVMYDHGIGEYDEETNSYNMNGGYVDDDYISDHYGDGDMSNQVRQTILDLASKGGGETVVPDTKTGASTLQIVDTEGGPHHGLAYPILYNKLSEVCYLGTTQTYHWYLFNKMAGQGDSSGDAEDRYDENTWLMARTPIPEDVYSGDAYQRGWQQLPNDLKSRILIEIEDWPAPTPFMEEASTANISTASANPVLHIVDTHGCEYHGAGLPLIYDPLHDEGWLATTSTYHIDLADQGLPDPDEYGDYVLIRVGEREFPVERFYLHQWAQVSPEMKALVEREVSVWRGLTAPEEERILPTTVQSSHEHTADYNTSYRWLFDPKTESVHVWPLFSMNHWDKIIQLGLEPEDITEAGYCFGDEEADYWEVEDWAGVEPSDTISDAVKALASRGGGTTTLPPLVGRRGTEVASQIAEGNSKFDILESSRWVLGDKGMVIVAPYESENSPPYHFQLMEEMEQRGETPVESGYIYHGEVTDELIQDVSPEVESQVLNYVQKLASQQIADVYGSSDILAVRLWRWAYSPVTQTLTVGNKADHLIMMMREFPTKAWQSANVQLGYIRNGVPTEYHEDLNWNETEVPDPLKSAILNLYVQGGGTATLPKISSADILADTLEDSYEVVKIQNPQVNNFIYVITPNEVILGNPNLQHWEMLMEANRTEDDEDIIAQGFVNKLSLVIYSYATKISAQQVEQILRSTGYLNKPVTRSVAKTARELHRVPYMKFNFGQRYAPLLYDGDTGQVHQGEIGDMGHADWMMRVEDDDPEYANYLAGLYDSFATGNDGGYVGEDGTYYFINASPPPEAKPRPIAKTSTYNIADAKIENMDGADLGGDNRWVYDPASNILYIANRRGGMLHADMIMKAMDRYMHDRQYQELFAGFVDASEGSVRPVYPWDPEYHDEDELYEAETKEVADQVLRLLQSKTVANVAKTAAAWEIVKHQTDDSHGGGLPFIINNGKIHIGTGEGYHWSLGVNDSDAQMGRHLYDKTVFYQNPWAPTTMLGPETRQDVANFLHQNNEYLYNDPDYGEVEPTSAYDSALPEMEQDTRNYKWYTPKTSRVQKKAFSGPGSWTTAWSEPPMMRPRLLYDPATDKAYFQKPALADHHHDLFDYYNLPLDDQDDYKLGTISGEAEDPELESAYGSSFTTEEEESILKQWAAHNKEGFIVHPSGIGGNPHLQNDVERLREENPISYEPHWNPAYTTVKEAIKITLRSINDDKPIGQSPVIYDNKRKQLWINPNAGYAGHFTLYNAMMNAGIDPDSIEECHGYYRPDWTETKGKSFSWTWGDPDPSLEAGFETVIRSVLGKTAANADVLDRFNLMAPSGYEGVYNWNEDESGYEPEDQSENTWKFVYAPTYHKAFVWSDGEVGAGDGIYAHYYGVQDLVEELGLEDDDLDELHKIVTGGFIDWNQETNHYTVVLLNANGPDCPDILQDLGLSASEASVDPGGSFTIGKIATTVKEIQVGNSHGGGLPWFFDTSDDTLYVGSNEAPHVELMMSAQLPLDRSDYLYDLGGDAGLSLGFYSGRASGRESWFSFEPINSNETHNKIQDGMDEYFSHKTAARVLPLEIVGNGDPEDARTQMSPIIYNEDNQTLYFRPGGGYAGHQGIYMYMMDHGVDTPTKEVHGYYDPEQTDMGGEDGLYFYSPAYTFVSPTPALRVLIKTTLEHWMNLPHLFSAVDRHYSAEVPNRKVLDWPEFTRWYTSWIYIPETKELLIDNTQGVNHAALLQSSNLDMDDLPQDAVFGLILRNYVSDELLIYPNYSDRARSQRGLMDDSYVQDAVNAVQLWASQHTNWGMMKVAQDEMGGQVQTDDIGVGMMFSPFHHLLKAVQFGYPWIRERSARGHVVRHLHEELSRKFRHRVRHKHKHSAIKPDAVFKWSYSPNKLEVWPVDENGMPDHFRQLGMGRQQTDSQGHIYLVGPKVYLYVHPDRPWGMEAKKREALKAEAVRSASDWAAQNLMANPQQLTAPQAHKEVNVGAYRPNNTYKFIAAPDIGFVKVWQDDEYGIDTSDSEEYSTKAHMQMILDHLEEDPEFEAWWQYEESIAWEEKRQSDPIVMGTFTMNDDNSAAHVNVYDSRSNDDAQETMDIRAVLGLPQADFDPDGDESDSYASKILANVV